MEIALKIRVKNGVLQEFLDRRGWRQSDLARHLGVTPMEAGRWLNMRGYPSKPEMMLRLARLVGRSPEEMFPPPLMDKDWLTGMREWTVYKNVEVELLPFYQIKGLPAPDEVDVEGLCEADLEKLKTTMVEVLQELDGIRPREAAVLRMRFGLDGGEEKTLDEVSAALGVGRERARQIEARALRRLRHPSLGKALRAFGAEGWGRRRRWRWTPPSPSPPPPEDD